ICRPQICTLTFFFAGYNIPTMKAKLIYHVKEITLNGDILEIKIWQIPKSKDKPHGFKYSFAYIRRGKRLFGYDNAERKGDHKHVGNREIPYQFKSVDQLFADFHRDIINLREKEYESKKHKNQH
ncbi:MAG: DUF6516 family protein, partial [Thermodesulfobacteriota bacterium]|nr:DUF6516 family protein [Thermodesulfobacteriota bacterium]